jgi:hypothetical protein
MGTEININGNTGQVNIGGKDSKIKATQIVTADGKVVESTVIINDKKEK